ncbi:MAG: hypothetical protein IMZ55_16255 [Acidobacteria bacterium]|nr:hypothetical protein [Acidobacteriota bacterium]
MPRVGSQSTVGFLYAGRESGGYSNRVYGPDGFLRFSPSDAVRFQFLRSDTRYPSRVAEEHGQRADPGAGRALLLDYQHVGRTWVWVASYEDRDPAFRGDSGFIPRVDVRTGEVELQRRFWGSATSWFTRAAVGVRGLRTTDHTGRLTDQIGAIYVTYQGVTYNLTRNMFDCAIQPGGTMRLGLSGQVGDEIDVANARPASLVRLGPSLEWKLGAPLNLHVNHTLERLSVAGGKLYTANLTQLRVIYHFNVHTFIRAILQFTDVSRNTALAEVPSSASMRRLVSQYLFSYKLNPRTVLLVGYSDNASGAARERLVQANRTFFIKIGYAWIL